MLSSGYRINAPRVTYETFGDEVVLIDFESGAYFSINRIGADILEAIESGAGPRQIVNGIVRRYAGERETIEAAVSRLLDELAAENLISPAEISETDDSTPDAPMPAGGVEGAGQPFEPPVLNKYTDMEDLVMLDPIHEVDETGWPNPKPDGAGE